MERRYWISSHICRMWTVCRMPEADSPLEVEIPEKLLLKLPNEQQGCVREILAEDPRPSYQNDPDRVYGMEYAGYEIKFRVKDYRLTVCEIERVAADRIIK